jgi:hypothetical protein
MIRKELIAIAVAFNRLFREWSEAEFPKSIG